MKMSYRYEELNKLYDTVSISSDDVVLDVLCGDGFASKSLIGKVGRLFGADRKQKASDFPNEIIYSQQEAQSLAFGDTTFSLVIAHTGFHHVGQGNPAEQQRAVKEFYRILKHHGTFLLSDLEGNSAASRLNDDYMPDHDSQCVWLTANYSSNLLVDAGFRGIDVKSVIIRWQFTDRSQLESCAKSVFKVDGRTLDEYGLSDGLTIRLPFLYARGTKL